jgi:hypothetical protein
MANAQGAGDQRVLRIVGLSGVFGILRLLIDCESLRHAMMIWDESSLRPIHDSRPYLGVQIGRRRGYIGRSGHWSLAVLLSVRAWLS